MPRHQSSRADQLRYKPASFLDSAPLAVPPLLPSLFHTSLSPPLLTSLLASGPILTSPYTSTPHPLPLSVLPSGSALPESRGEPSLDLFFK